MGLRPARIYRDMDAKRPYTRKAVRVHNKEYIRGIPGSKLHTFHMGNKNGDFDTAIHLLPKVNTTIRHNALDASRVAANAYLKKAIGNEIEYFIKVRVYPHHVLREHAQAAIAQADRFYQGMSHPFGKPSGLAARVRKEQPILTIYLSKKNLASGKEAARRAGAKIPGGSRTEIE